MSVRVSLGGFCCRFTVENPDVGHNLRYAPKYLETWRSSLFF